MEHGNWHGHGAWKHEFKLKQNMSSGKLMSLMKSSLSKRKLRVLLNAELGVSQGNVLGPFCPLCT